MVGWTNRAARLLVSNWLILTSFRTTSRESSSRFHSSTMFSGIEQVSRAAVELSSDVGPATGRSRYFLIVAWAIVALPSLEITWNSLTLRVRSETTMTRE